ncbi:MAG: hypothetical protein NDJ19_08890 [Ramlibacter sp.]|nr:hypothetical protein [Ramlibacter sp.]
MDRDSPSSLLAEYSAALERQRAEWTLATDAAVGAVERVKAYARWLAASERVKSLSAAMGRDQPIQPCRP